MKTLEESQARITKISKEIVSIFAAHNLSSAEGLLVLESVKEASSMGRILATVKKEMGAWARQ